MTSEADRQALLTYLYRTLDMLPGVPPSMQVTLRTACMKAVKRLHLHGALTGAEANHLATRVRDTHRNRKPSCCGLDDLERRT